MMESPVAEPTLRRPPPRLAAFLIQSLNTPQHLSSLPTLLAGFGRQCNHLAADVGRLRHALSLAVAASFSRYNDIDIVHGRVREDLERLGVCPSNSRQFCGGVEMRSGMLGMGINSEILVLARELRWIEQVKVYVETGLKLESVVGDLEDAAFSYMSSTSQNLSIWRCKQEHLSAAVKAINEAENILASIVTKWPKWKHLVRAVDVRLEKSLAVFRHQALSDHRVLLSSLGWPHPVFVSDVSRENGSKISTILDLVLDSSYSKSFFVISTLPHLQTRREARFSTLLGNLQNLHDPSLWTVDELVSFISSRAESYFVQWSDKPEFIFALVYKITRDFVGEAEEALQPLIDKAWLKGYSVREAWVLSMIKLLSGHLKNQIFTLLTRNYTESGGSPEAMSLWLDVIDLMATFNRKMQALACTENSVFHLNEISRRISLFSLFHDRLDWLQIWAQIELKDAETKLQQELFNENTWISMVGKMDKAFPNGESGLLLPTSIEDHKAPEIAGVVVLIARSMIERCQCLPSLTMRVQFIKLSVSKFLIYFFDLLLWKYQELELNTLSVNASHLLKSVSLLNAVRYWQHTLRQWNEENILDINDEHDVHGREKIDAVTYVFEAEGLYLSKLENEWMEGLMTAILREFNALGSNYVRRIVRCKYVGENHVESDDQSKFMSYEVSTELVEALDMLKERMRFLNVMMNVEDFTDIWRSVCGGLDLYMSKSVFSGRDDLPASTVNQLEVDMVALFSVFQPFCARPEAFLPLTRDALKALAS